MCFSRAHISISVSTPNHPQPRLSIRCIHISGTGHNGACTRAHAHIPQGATRLSGNNTHPRAQRRTIHSSACPSAVHVIGCEAPAPNLTERSSLLTEQVKTRPASGPVPGNAKSAILCHKYRGELTMILTGYLPSHPDIPEAQDDCLRVLYGSNCGTYHSWKEMLFEWDGYPGTVPC